MAPEQARSEPVDARADLYALGAVLYAMAVGRPRFRADSTLAVLKRVCEDRHRPVRQLNPDVPDWLEMMIDGLLAKDPDDRFQAAGEVADLLQQGLAHLQEPAVSPPPGILWILANSRATDDLERLDQVPTPLLGRPTRSPRRLVFGAGLVLLLLVGLGGSEATGLTKVQVDGETIVIGGTGPQEVSVRPGTHLAWAIRAGLPVGETRITIRKGGREIVNIGLEPPGPAAVEGSRPPPGSATRADAMPPAGTRGGIERKRGLVWSLAFLRDGDRLAIGQQGLNGHIPATGALGDRDTPAILRIDDMAAIARSSGRRMPMHSGVLPWRPTGKFAAGCFDGRLLVYDLEGWPSRLIFDETLDDEPINVARFNPNGTAVIAGTW